jgi:hypothetical protein
MFNKSSVSFPVDRITNLLKSWLIRQISGDELTWFIEKQEEISDRGEAKTLFTTFSSVPRYLGKQKLNVSEVELQKANDLVSGWNPGDWTIDGVGRTVLILSFPHEEPNRYINTLDKIFETADVREAIALYQSLPLLPHPERFKLRAAEGIRSNLTSVFNAVALNNPYPAAYLDDLAWNQMILKALFVGSPLKLIYGLQQSNNRQLCQMLIDYARERLAAKRNVNPELWQLVASFNPQAVTSLEAEFTALFKHSRPYPKVYHKGIIYPLGQ